MKEDSFAGRWARIIRPNPQSEVDDELAFHVEQRVEEYVALGMDPVAARRAALERFGDLEGVRGECAHLLIEERRAEARRDWLEDLRQDLVYGVRSALRAPLFSLLAVLTLALGIGANAAVFGLMKSVLLDSLPYDDADRLVRVYARPDDDPRDRQGLSAGVVADLAERQRSFTRLAPFYHNTFDATYIGEAGPRLLTGALVGAGLFRTLGVPAAIGRAFTDTDAGSDAPPVVMLSHDAWQREFAGDPDVAGKRLRIDGDAHEVIGVLPHDFVGPMGEADLWFPLDLGPALRDPNQVRGQHWLGLIGRLKAGTSVETAQREFAAIAADLAREHPDSDGGRTLTTLSVRDAMVGETRTPLVLLMASAGLVLLITCANLAGAMLSRTLSRRNEFAVRVALGARRGRLIRQLLTESTLLAAAGGAAGLLLASLGLALLRGVSIPALPAYADLSLDRGAVIVTTLVTLLTGLAFGLAPALSAGRSNPQGTLRGESRGTSESRRSRRLRGVLVAGQIAVSLSLLVGAGLLVRSLSALLSAPLGFNPDGVLTVGVQLPRDQYAAPEVRIRFFAQLEERVRRLPGVRAVADVSELPAPGMNRNALVIEGRTLDEDGPTFIAYSSVSHDYFRTLGIPLKRGRSFDAQDRADAPPTIVISESMARRYWPDGNAIGARIRISPHTAEQWGVVAGIVGDVRGDPALPEPEPMVYGSARQDASRSGRIYVVRTHGDPLALVGQFQRELSALDPGLPIRDATTLSAIMDERLAGRRLPVLLITVFGALALLLASVGVYAMFASMAAAREREFGVRVALGSTRGAIAALVLRQGAGWMVAGLAGGALGVVAATWLLRDLLYGVRPFDPLAVGVASGTLLACATIALLGPVRRATRVDPVTAMRA